MVDPVLIRWLVMLAGCAAVALLVLGIALFLEEWSRILEARRRDMAHPADPEARGFLERRLEILRNIGADLR